MFLRVVMGRNDVVDIYAKSPNTSDKAQIILFEEYVRDEFINLRNNFDYKFNYIRSVIVTRKKTDPQDIFTTCN